MFLERRRQPSPVLDHTKLTIDEVPHVTRGNELEATELLNALDLAPSATNRLAVGWTFARGEFDGLRVEAPVRMTAREASTWL